MTTNEALAKGIISRFERLERHHVAQLDRAATPEARRRHRYFAQGLKEAIAVLTSTHNCQPLE